MAEINANTPWQDLTIGGNIYEAGNARNFKTGDWRCAKVCPFGAIEMK